MTVVFISNFFNHHQAPLSDALWEQTGGQFTFVETEPMPPMCRQLGYPELKRGYILPFPEKEEEVLRRILTADVVIAGSAPEALVRQRIKTGKLLLRYTERPLRNGRELWKYLPRFCRWHWRNLPGKPIYLLCASAYAPGDYGKFGLFRGKCWRWGYFPPVKRYILSELMAEKNPKRILWCGRLVGLKHPEEALQAAKRLKEDGFSFSLGMIGSGEEEAGLREQIAKWGLEDRVQLLGAMPADQVRREMERSGIFLFTSDAREGWGAVLNEAMNSGCAVLTSDGPGAVPFLIKPGENGLSYPFGDREGMYQALTKLLRDPEEQRKLGTGAYHTIIDKWNAPAAARRLLAVCGQLLRGQGLLWFPDGPCSKAEVLKGGQKP